MKPADIRDVAIETVTDHERLLIERLASVEADRDAYQLVAREAIHALHHLMRDHDRLRQQHYRLLDEYRSLREKTLREVMAA